MSTNEKIGITPEAVEVKIEGANPNLDTSNDFIALGSFRDQQKTRKNKINRAAEKIASGTTGTKKDKKKNKGNGKNDKPAAEPKVVGHTKDGDEILEGEFKPVDSDKSSTKAEDKTLDVVRKDLPDMVAKFRKAVKGDLSNFVKMASESLSFKSRVYGGLIREFADANADFFERVLLETVDTKFIEAFAGTVGALQNEKSMREVINGLDSVTEEIDIRPNDIDKVEYERAYKRTVAATKALFIEIRNTTFETDSFTDRFVQFTKWAKENEMFFMTDGPEGCQCGYRDCDGNIYDVDKKLYDPKAKDKAKDKNAAA